MTALEELRRAAPEFAEVGDRDVTALMESLSPMVGKKAFGRMWPLAMAYYTAHMLKVQEALSSGESAAGGAASAFMTGIQSMTENKLSISFRDPSSSGKTAADEALSRTLYGQMFLALRAQCVIAVRTRMG